MDDTFIIIISITAFISIAVGIFIRNYKKAEVNNVEDSAPNYFEATAPVGEPSSVTIRYLTEDEIDANVPSFLQISTIYSPQLEREANDQLPEYHEIICIEDLPTYHEVMNGYQYDNNSGIVR